MGVALLISIFVLLLVCVVAIALVVASGTESALSGNYRSATSVYYAALAGLEEGRGRLLPRNPDYFPNANPNFLPPPGTPMSTSNVSYVLNPVSGETVAPWDTSTSTTYPDKEYSNEFPSNPPPTSPQLQTVNSTFISNNPSGIQGPLYKWVRINAVTEYALGLDIDDLHSIRANYDQTTPVYYDGTHLNLTSTGVQVLEITSLAVLPNGTQKMLQYLVAPNSILLPPFPAAVTLLGNNVDYTGPFTSLSSNSPPPPPTWIVSGNDTISLGSCVPNSTPAYAVGYFNNTDKSYGNIYASNSEVKNYAGNYPGLGGSSTSPSLGYIAPAIPSNFQDPGVLNSMVQTIIKENMYDKLIVPPTGTATGADLPSGMSPSNMKTIVVQGNLDLSNSFHSTGYGLLIVTGKLTFDPDSSWYGIVMLIGQGLAYGYQGRSTDQGKITGALFVAKTVDSSGNPLPVGSPLPDWGGDGVEMLDKAGDAMGGIGFFYSSCWIKAATPAGAYQMLSFHEISQ